MLSHDDLIGIGVKILKNTFNCGAIYKEPKSLNKEIPDIIGFRSEGSFVIEAKTSLKDFKNDLKKSFRLKSESGMGDWRFYITPKNLINQDMLPQCWGLIEVNKNRNFNIIYNPFGRGNIYSRWYKNKKDKESEWRLMYSKLNPGE